MKQSTLFLVLLAMIMVACGGESDERTGLVGPSSDPTATRQASSDDNSPLRDLPTAHNQVLHLPETDALPGRLLYVQGNTDNPSLRIGPGGRLFLAAFNGREPIQLAERVSEASVMISHDRSMVGYAAIDGFSWNLYIMDLEDQQPILIYDLPNRFGFIEGWSPDMNWVLFRSNNTLVISSIDGTTQYEFPNAYILWLEDNRALVIDVDNFFNDNEQSLNDLFIFNPVTSERISLDPGLTTVSVDTFPVMTLQTMLQEQGTNIVATSTGGPGVFGFPLLLLDNETQLVLDSPTQVNAMLNPCDSWVINERGFTGSGDASPIYSSEDTLNLSDFARLNEDLIIFTRWYMQNCDTQVESLRSELLTVDTEGNVTVIADDLYPGISTTFMRASTGKRYTISPDGRFVAVITGSFTGMNSAIQIVDLVTGDSVDVMTWQSADANSFLIWEAFTAIFWVN